MSKSGFSLNDKKIKFSLTVKQKFRNTNFRPIMIEEVSRNWMELLSLNQMRLIMLMQEMNNFDEINKFFMNSYWNKIEELREAHEKRWKNWSDFKGLHSMNFREENWSKIETLSLNSQARFRNYRMKLVAWMIREICKDAESVRSGNSHVTSEPAFFTPFRDPGGMLSRSLGMPSRNNGPPSICDTQGFSGNVFANPAASSSAPLSTRVQSLDF